MIDPLKSYPKRSAVKSGRLIPSLFGSLENIERDEVAAVVLSSHVHVCIPLNCVRG